MSYGPYDPIGTVRAVDGFLAVRVWEPVFDIGAGELSEGFTAETIASWPIVYQPPES